MRIGFGYDSHVFTSGRPLVLGGITIPYEQGLKGHSDADVLIHSIIDALLGAAALGDIGMHFPDTDKKWEGADSKKLLFYTVQLVKDAGFTIGNIDSTVICERPKLRSYIDEIRNCLSSILEIGIDQISVKGKTNEKMDDVGAGKGIVVHTVALLQ